MQMSCNEALDRLNGREIFDVVFMDPPYNKEYEKDVLIFLGKSDLINNHCGGFSRYRYVLRRRIRIWDYERKEV